MLVRGFTAGVVCLAIAATAPVYAQCAASPFGAATGHSIYVSGDLQQAGTDTDGKLAAGGNIALVGFGVGGQLPQIPAQEVLIAGDSISFQHGTVYGNAVFGGSGSFPSVDIKGSAYQASPIDFAATNALLQGLSAALQALPLNGSLAFQYGQLTFTGDDPERNVFATTSAVLAATNTLTIQVPPGATAVINISGNSAQMQNFGIFLQGTASDKVLFHFPDATALNVQWVGVTGSILAPDAAITFNSASAVGTIIGASLQGTGHTALPGFTGCLPGPAATPTVPATQTQTPTASQSPSATQTQTSTATSSPTATASDTTTPEPTPTATDTATQTPTSTFTPTVTASATATSSLTPPPTATPSATPSETATLTPTSTATESSTPTQTDTPTATPSPSDTPTWTPTPTLTATGTATPTPILCGNGVIDAGEQCDDSNMLNGDCCDADCQVASADGNVCDDGNACTQSDTCLAGACLGADPLVCAPDACHSVLTCEPSTGSCVGPVTTESPACDTCTDCTDNDGDGDIDDEDSGCSILAPLYRLAVVSTSLGRDPLYLGGSVLVNGVAGMACSPDLSRAGVCGNDMAIRADSKMGILATAGEAGFGQATMEESTLEIREQFVSNGGVETLHGVTPLVGPGACSNNALLACLVNSDCPMGATCDGRKRLDDPSNTHVDRSGTAENFVRCTGAMGSLSAISAQIATLPGNVAGYTTGSAADIDTSSSLPLITITLAGGLQVMEVERVLVGGNHELRLIGQPDTILVIRVARQLRMGADSLVSLMGGLTPNHVLWNVEGDRGGQAIITGGSSFSGTVLAPERRGIRVGASVRVYGALASQRLQIEGNSIVDHHPFVGLSIP